MFLGRCYAMGGDNANAMKYYNASLQYDPNNAEVYDDLAQMYNYAKDPAKAKECADKAAAIRAMKK
jgi:Tfp pilus assembly protein PilF